MPRNESTVRYYGMHPVACGALVALACMALASCGGGPGAAQPDLVVEDPAVRDHRSDAGTSFTFSVTVRNAGAGKAAATTLRVYRSDDAAIETSDHEEVAVPVAVLAASASRLASVTVTAPSSPGTSYYGACVEPVARESDTANNCSTAVEVTVPEAQDAAPAEPVPMPDLVVESPAVSDHRPTAGTSFTFSVTVRNAGDGSAAETTLRVYRSDDATVTTSDHDDKAVTLPELAASESTVASVKLSAPSSSGTYYYGACVQAMANESDTANNCSAPLKVTVQTPQIPVSRPPQPDVEANLHSVWPVSPPVGGLFELEVGVRNPGGTRIAPTTRLRVYLSMDATITQSDKLLASWELWWFTSYPNTRSVVVYHRQKAPSIRGTYYYGVCVDAVAGESDTANNCVSKQVAVLHDKPDLGVSRLSIGRGWGQYSTGTRLWSQVAVLNYGSPSDSTTVRLLLLPDGTSEPSAGTQVGELAVPELVVNSNWAATSIRNVEFQTPATAGTYHYVMCVDAVPRETNMRNNCSAAVAIEVL